MLDFFKNYLEWVPVCVVILICILVYLNREKKFVRQIFVNAIIEAEKHFNSGHGQEKLTYATLAIKSHLPKWLGFFITKSMIVTGIEYLLRKGCIIFDVDMDIDIKGNEEVEIPKKIDIDLKDNKIEISLGKKENIYPETEEENAHIYGSVKVKTDWHGEPDTTVEIGIKKKL